MPKKRAKIDEAFIRAVEGDSDTPMLAEFTVLLSSGLFPDQLMNDLTLLTVFIIQIITFGGLMLQAVHLSLRTIFRRRTTNYWKSFLISLVATAVVLVIEIWVLGSMS